MEEQDYIDLILKINGIYCMFLCIAGTIGNLFLTTMCFITPLRKSSTFVFLGVMAVADSVTLYWFNLDHFFKPYFGFDRNKIWFHFCRWDMFFQYVSLCSSAWLLVTLSFERYLSVRIKTWSIKFTHKQALVAALLVVLFFILFNSNILFTFGVVSFVNGTNVTRFTCYTVNEESKWMDYWRTIFAVFYSALPFALIIIANLLLIYEIKKHTGKIAQTEERKKKQKSMNRMVITMALLYIVFTLPTSVVTSFLNKWLQEWGGWGDVIIYIINSFTFSYHALNILIVIYTNTRFLNEVKVYFKGNKQDTKDSATKSTNVQQA